MAEASPAPLRLRQSCDRCHAQKLRCVRESNNTHPSGGVADHRGSCQRCNRLRSKCVYSISAPKGRPSIYSVTPRIDSPQKPSKDGPAISNAETLDDQSRVSASTMPADEATVVVSSNNITATSPFELPGQKENGMNYDADQWFQQFVDAGSADSTVIDANMLDWAFDESNNMTEHQFHVFDTSSSNDEISSRSMSSSVVEPTSTKTNENGAALSESLEKLSRLNMRLCTFNSLTSAFALDGCGHHDGPIVDEAAVITMTSWMSHASNGTSNDTASAAATAGQASDSVGAVMCDIFSAARELWEILGSLTTCHSSATGSSSPAEECQASPITNMLASSNCSEHRELTSLVMVEDESSTRKVRDAVDQMVIACSILLMNIFTVVITAIQRDAEQWAPTTPMADIRPILVTQVCSYVIDRHNRALDTYDQGRPQSQSLDSDSAIKTLEMSARREELARLRGDVQIRFDRLRKFLRI